MEKLDLRIHLYILNFLFVFWIMELRKNEKGFVLSKLFGVRNLSRLIAYIGFGHLCGYVCFKFHDVDGRLINIRRTVKGFAVDEAV